MEASTLTAMLLALPALVLGGLAGAWFVSRSAQRRIDDAQALAASQIDAARAAPEEKVRGLEAQLAELRRQQAQALETARELTQADNEKAVRWLSNGAQPSERVEKILKISGAWDEFETAKTQAKSGS